MEYYYDKKLVWKYSIGIISLIITAILLAINVKTFLIPGIIFAIFGIAHTAGSYKMIIEILTRRILVDRDGIHFYYKEKEVTFIPWKDINDYSITETRCILRVSGKLHFLNTQVEKFEELEQVIIEQLNLPKEIRGLRLAKYDTLPSLGGKPVEVEDIKGSSESDTGKLDYLKEKEGGTGFRPSERIKEALSFSGESPRERLKKLNLMEIVKEKYNPSYAGVQDLHEEQEEEDLLIPVQQASKPSPGGHIPFNGEDDDF